MVKKPRQSSLSRLVLLLTLGLICPAATAQSNLRSAGATLPRPSAHKPFGSRPAPPYSGVRIDVDLLHFNSMTLFEASVRNLSEQGAKLGHDEALRAFEDWIGFHSLRRSIAGAMAAGYADGTPDPDDHFISDPLFRGLLSAHAELRIGGSIYAIFETEVYEITDADRQTVLDLRAGVDVSGRGNVVIHALGGPEGGCETDWSEVRKKADGLFRRMKSKAWVENWVVYHSVGARTVYQEDSNGLWFPKSAEIIAATGKFIVTKYDGGRCSSAKTIYFDKWEKDRSLTSAVYATGGTNRLAIEDCLSSQHFAGGGHSARYDYICYQDNCAIPDFSVDSGCEDEPVILEAASSGEDRYFIEVFQTDRRYSSDVTGPYYASGFIEGSVPATIDLEALAFPMNAGVWKVKLAVQNGCTEWNERSRWIGISPIIQPVAILEVDQLVCHGNSIHFDTAGSVGNSFSLEICKVFSPGASSPCSPSDTMTYNQPIGGDLRTHFEHFQPGVFKITWTAYTPCAGSDEDVLWVSIMMYPDCIYRQILTPGFASSLASPAFGLR